MNNQNALMAVLLLGATCTSVAAHAENQKPSLQQQIQTLQAAMETQQHLLEAQKQQLDAQRAELDALRAQLPTPTPAQSQNTTTEQLAKQQVQLDSLQQFNDRSKLAAQEQAKLAFTGNRPTITSADGRSSLSLRANVQLDAAHYDQAKQGSATTDFRRGSVGGTGNRETNGAQDLSDGVYFRRARFGVEGVIARDFNYRLLLELGGGGTEGPTRINDAWLNYTGFAPFAIQLGAFSPSANLDDATTPEDLLFIERASSAELSRTLGGADGRLGFGIKGNGSRWMGALTLTSRTVNDAEVFDAQLGTVGRVGFLVATAADYNIHLGASGTYVWQAADQGVGTVPRRSIRLRDRPEIRVDSTRLIDTGGIDARHASVVGIEFAANWKNFYVQAEDFRFDIERRQPTTLSNPSFNGYYIQSSWVLTGESHRYNMATASYQSPRPYVPFTSAGGYGAWELALRYSHTDLNDNAGAAGTAATAASIRGGLQNIWTIGVNWYVNNNMRFLLDYEDIAVDRLNPAGTGNLTPFGASPLTPPLGTQIGQDLHVYALRSQFSF